MYLDLNENIVTQGDSSTKKMVVFEMDNMLLKGNFILTCADKFVFDQELVRLRKAIKDPLLLLKSIAKLFCGLTEEQLVAVIEQMEFVDGTKNMVRQLQNHGYTVGIISDSYQFAVNHVKELLKIDFAIGNRLEFDSGVATGAIIVPAYYFYHPEKRCGHDFCKTNALIYAAKIYGISVHNTIAISSTEKDLCLISHAGVGVALRPRNYELQTAADIVIDKLDFETLSNLEHLQRKEII